MKRKCKICGKPATHRWDIGTKKYYFCNDHNDADLKEE